MSLDRILVAVDGSDAGRCALDWTVALAAQSGAAVTMLAVWMPPNPFGMHLLPFPEDSYELEAKQLLDHLATEVPGAGAFELATCRGYPGRAIVEEGTSRGVDLTVVGSRGRNILAQVLLGSVSRTVAATAEGPVAIIPPGCAEPGAGEATSPRRLGPLTVVGFDGSKGAEAALVWALDHCEGPIHAVAAWHIPTGIAYDNIVVDPEPFHESAKLRLDESLRAFGGGAIPERVTPVTRIGDGRAVLTASDLGAAQVVVGARSHRGWAGALLGSTATYVAGRSTVPVIIVPPTEEDPDAD